MTEKNDIPRSCDTFVALPPATADGCIVFGKNSDRPSSEIQEVVYVPAQDHIEGSHVSCTYMQIDQIARTHAVILSKPSWMWGAEMGSNEHGVCVGNEAVWTKLNGPDDLVEKLLGMDLLRLLLVSLSVAKDGLEVIANLLTKYGQGGPCGEDPSSTKWSYHNSFLIADRTEAWVLETAGRFWAAEKVTEGVRNISNDLSIETKIDLMSPNLIDEAKSLGLYSDDDGPFNFAKVFSECYTSSTSLARSDRFSCGRRLMKDLSKGGTFGVKEMFQILRDEDSGICMSGSFTSTGSQVSLLTPPTSSSPCCHWFTATPNPKWSIYKPFIFCPGASVGDVTKSPQYGADDPVRKIPRFQTQVDRQHKLNKGHENLLKLLEKEDPSGKMVLKNIQELETKCLEDMDEILKNFDEKSCTKVSQIFDHMCNIELNFYSTISCHK
ncbi:hypothetical protein KUTeg_008077 [Tegillarca granosa]|uniref:Secernin-2 n=1 Tax=Tegillarca granosa TaxID=220873 RepID=A0ABQ9FA81_TEGGR|nr:hypothetical protein KUTeg_008077 [Tegillarca granosa]